MTAGRPTDYNAKVSAKLCSRIADGTSLRKVCEMDDMPSTQTVYVWLGKHSEFVEHYTRAKVDSGDSDADRIENIAEKVISGEIEPQAARVAIDAYKWTAGKKRPKKYGDKIHTEHSGSVDLHGLSDEELQRKRDSVQQTLDQSTNDK